MKKKYLFISTLTALLSITLSSCNKVISVDNIIPTELLTSEAPRETYHNDFGKDNIPGYWDSYGCGDPFVLRHNGMFYLYVSTKVESTGVMAWKSIDLINWELCECEGLPKGYVTTDDSTYTAYAPEVTYYNGYFYMCESRRGKGHYFLKSRSPEGPFVACSNNEGEQIDGSFFIDDSEQVYFLRASNAGIRVVETVIDNDGDMTLNKSNNRQLANTQIGSWTEGPYLLKKDGMYYLTYTGTNVISSAYRVAYSYHEESGTDSFFSTNAFTYGNILTLNTSEKFNGLGHSATVMGPNMDSYYIVYHNLVSVNGPYRHYNVSRLMFNGSEMSVNHPEREDNLVPQMPDFYTFDDTSLNETGSFVLSDKQSEDAFTAEFNATGNNDYVFAYKDANNYAYVSMASNDTLSLHVVKNGSDSNAQSIVMNKDYDYETNHTYRIVHKDGRVVVYFDTMKKMEVNLDESLGGGYIGYKGNVNHGYTAFTNAAFDSSQQDDYKQDGAVALSYDADISRLSDKSITYLTKQLEDSNGYEKGAAITLHNDEYATYKTYVEKDGYYGVDITVPCSMMGKRVGLRLDNEELKYCDIKSYEMDEDIIRLHIGSVLMKKGVHFITLYNVGDEVTFSRLDWYQTTDIKTTFEHDLQSFVSEGAMYVNTWKIKNGGHYALSGNRQLMYFGNDTMRDYSVEVDIAFDDDPLASTAGIVLRCSNPAYSVSDDVNSIQGFYCGLNLTKTFITECNYNQTLIGVSDAIEYQSKQFHHLKAEVRGNVVKFYIDDVLAHTYVSALGPTHGQAAFYTNGAAAIYKNLKIVTL